MSLIKSHHTNLNEKNIVNAVISLEVIKEVSMYIIKKHASLIVDIEAGKANNVLLEKEIVAYLDELHQYQQHRDQVIEMVMHYMFGYGILQQYIDDDDVSDIDICRYDFVIIKRLGVKEISPITFEDEATLTNFSKLVVIRNGGVINENDCHARVSDEHNRLRINVTIGPRNTSGTSMTIRKHRKRGYVLEDLVTLNMMDIKTKLLLKQLSKTTSRILIVGKGASGKTTLLRAILKEIPLTERFLVCESESELYPENANFIVQKVQTEKIDTSLNQLVKDGLTMSLDGYCVGELVGDEVYEFLKAGYTDHRILGTLHALGVEETISRILSMTVAPEKHFDEFFIAGAIDIIIYMRKFKVIAITEVISENKSIRYNPLVSLKIERENQHKIHGEYKHLNVLKSRLKYEHVRRS